MSMDSFNLNILFSIGMSKQKVHWNWNILQLNRFRLQLGPFFSDAGRVVLGRLVKAWEQIATLFTWIERWEIVEHKWMMKIHKTWNCDAAALRFSADSRKKHKFLQFCNIGWQHTRRGIRAVKYFRHPTWHQYVIIWFKTWNLICFRFIGAEMLPMKCHGSVLTVEYGTLLSSIFCSLILIGLKIIGILQWIQWCSKNEGSFRVVFWALKVSIVISPLISDSINFDG